MSNERQSHIERQGGATHGSACHFHIGVAGPQDGHNHLVELSCLFLKGKDSQNVSKL